MDDIFSSIKEEECEPPEYQQTPVEQQRSTSNTVLSRQKQKRHKSSQPTNTVYEDEKDLRNIKAERKRFMSSNVDKILAAEYKDQDAVRRKKSSNLHDEESYHDKEEFLKIRREIQAFGTQVPILCRCRWICVYGQGLGANVIMTCLPELCPCYSERVLLLLSFILHQNE